MKRQADGQKTPDSTSLPSSSVPVGWLALITIVGLTLISIVGRLPILRPVVGLVILPVLGLVVALLPVVCFLAVRWLLVSVPIILMVIFTALYPIAIFIVVAWCAVAVFSSILVAFALSGLLFRRCIVLRGRNVLPFLRVVEMRAL